MTKHSRAPLFSEEEAASLKADARCAIEAIERMQATVRYMGYRQNISTAHWKYLLVPLARARDRVQEAWMRSTIQ